MRDQRLVITVKNGAIALFPSGHTSSRLSTTQSGFRVMCDTAQADVHRPHRPPARDAAWVTLKRRGSRASLGFGWSGESVDRHYIGVTQGDCSEPPEIERAGGNDDEAGAAAHGDAVRRQPEGAALVADARTFGVAHGWSSTRCESDLLDGTGTRSRLDGTYRIILSRDRLSRLPRPGRLKPAAVRRR